MNANLATKAKGSAMRKSPSFQGQSGWLAAALGLALAGCAGAPVAVAPRFNGAWVNADASMHSWLQIEPHHVISFGLFQSNGRCVATDIEIVSKDRLNVPVSSLGTGEMSLRLNGGALVVTSKYATQRFVPAARESICQVGGKNLPGAPNPKQAN
jgi:hypothetical protein